MVKIDVSFDTFTLLIAGLYSVHSDIDPVAVPRSIWMELGERLEKLLVNWDYEKISLEDWISTCLFIYPLEALDVEQVQWYEENTECWTRMNGNVELLISMDVSML